MKGISLLAGICIITASCGSSKKNEGASAPVTIETLKPLIQGDWRWKDDTSFHFVVRNEKGWYISSATPVADTQEVNYVREACNPGARYEAAAKHLVEGDLLYLNIWKMIDGFAHKKRCLAVLTISDNSLKLMDTEKGVIFEYIR